MKDGDPLVVWGEHLHRKIKRSEVRDMRAFSLFLDECIARTKRDEDAVIAVTGDRGRGKSTLSLGASMVLSHRMKRDPAAFTWDNMCYRFEDLGELIDKAGNNDGLIYNIDEAIDVAHSKSAMSRANKELGKFMIRARKLRNIYFWNIPDFTELDSTIRNKVIQYWIHVFYKSEHRERNKRYGVAALFRKDLNPFNPDKWGFEETKKIVKRPIHDVFHLIKMFRKTRSYVATMAFPILPKIIEDMYKAPSFDALRESGKKFSEEFSGKGSGIKA